MSENSLPQTLGLTRNSRMPVGKTQVRLATASDARAAHRLFTTHLNWINVSYPHEKVVQRTATPLSMYEMFMSQVPCAVTLVDDLLVGFLLCDLRDPYVLEVVNLYVDDYYRRKGFGTKMLELVEKTATDNGIRTILGTVSNHWYPEKPPADDFLRSLNYEDIVLDSGTTLFIKRGLDSASTQQGEDSARRIRISSEVVDLTDI